MSRGRVLVVDDEPYVRQSLAALLRRRGFEVHLAASVDSAVRWVGASPDVVLTDLRMPEKDGLELVRTLGERETAPPVVVLTGHGTIPSAVECTRAGAFEYLTKPAPPDVLTSTLERAIASGRRAGGADERASPAPSSESGSESGFRFGSGSEPAGLPSNAPEPTLRGALLAEERRLVEDALRAAGGVKREAAKRLGIDERNLVYFLRKHGLN